MKQIDPVLTDRGSKYAVTGSEAKTKADALVVLKQLKRSKNLPRRPIIHGRFCHQAKVALKMMTAKRGQALSSYAC